MWIMLEPEDLLFFRDSRPFAAGEDHRAEGVFPPLPSAIAGALRTALIQAALDARSERKTFDDYNNPADRALDTLRTQFGTANNMGQVQLRGPLICLGDPGAPAPLLPMPADLLKGVPPRPDSVISAMPDAPLLPGVRAGLSGFAASLPLLRDTTIPAGDDGEGNKNSAGKEEGGWVEWEAMAGYLRGEPEPVSPARRAGGAGAKENFINIEENPGLALDSATRAARQGMLYSTRMQRPHWSPAAATTLLIQAELPAGIAPPSGCLPLGGEGRMVYARALGHAVPGSLADLLEGTTRQEIAKRIAEDQGRFRLALLTPGIFGAGWLPSLFAGGSQHTPSGPSCVLQGAAVGKPVSVGGWDLARRAPKPMRRAVPAGSVYFGQLTGADIEKDVERLLDLFHFRNHLQQADAITENGVSVASYYAQSGFGLTLVGAWTQNLGG